MQPTLKNGRNVWDRIHMPTREFQSRLRNLRKRMGEDGIDVLLAYGNGFDGYANPCYLSNFVIRLPRGALVTVTADGDAVLFFEGGSRGTPSVKALTCIEDVRACGDASRACAEYLNEKALTSGTIGLAGLTTGMPHYQLKHLKDATSGGKLVDADSIVEELRMLKSPRELDQIRRASRIVGRLFDFAGDCSFEAMGERAFEAALYREARMEGAEDVRVIFGRPSETDWALHPSEENPPDPGNALILYIAVAFERYWSEGIRTLLIENDSFSPPDLKELQDLYGRVAEGFKPGRSLASCHEGALEEIRKTGSEPITRYGLGRGIGLSLEELPLFDAEAAGELREGMCFTLRLAVPNRELGAAMIGNTFCLTPDGLETLTS